MSHPWPADRVTRRATSDLVPYARNARTHSPEQVAKIARSIETFGFTNPILVDETGMIIAGHGRVMAAKRLGIAEVPVMVAAGWTDEQRRAYVIADNQLALQAGWDEDILRDEIKALGDMGFDLDLIGFDDVDIAAFLTGLPGDEKEAARQTLAERFGVPPFTVLNARDGWWQERKRAWIALGIRSELGRGVNAGAANGEA